MSESPQTPPKRSSAYLLPQPKNKGKGKGNQFAVPARPAGPIERKGEGKGESGGADPDEEVALAKPSRNPRCIPPPPKPSAKAGSSSSSAKAESSSSRPPGVPKHRTRWHSCMELTSKYPPDILLLPPSGIPKEVTQIVNGKWVAPPVTLLRPKAEIRRGASRSHTSEVETTSTESTSSS